MRSRKTAFTLKSLAVVSAVGLFAAQAAHATVYQIETSTFIDNGFPTTAYKFGYLYDNSLSKIQITTDTFNVTGGSFNLPSGYFGTNVFSPGLNSISYSGTSTRYLLTPELYSISARPYGQASVISNIVSPPEANSMSFVLYEGTLRYTDSAGVAQSRSYGCADFTFASSARFTVTVPPGSTGPLVSNRSVRVGGFYSNLVSGNPGNQICFDGYAYDPGSAPVKVANNQLLFDATQFGGLKEFNQDQQWFEQLISGGSYAGYRPFVSSVVFNNNVPLPGTLLLGAIGALGLFAGKRSRS
jgi:hypothetical protein